MARASRNLFTTVKTEGGLLPPDFLQRLVEGSKAIDGLTLESYHLTGGEKPNEAASRSWNRLQTAWAAFQTASKGLKEEDAGTGLTREKWLLPLFSELGYGRLQAAKTFEIDGKAYAISHLWQQTPSRMPLPDAGRFLGTFLGEQQPIGGMFGQINQTLIRQFRMPGYPLVLITTDCCRRARTSIPSARRSTTTASRGCHRPWSSASAGSIGSTPRRNGG